jgi:MATE family multidrug resistance protein
MSWKQSWNADGGGRELLRLALPLILSSSFLTLQIFIDRVMLSRSSSDAVAASMPAAMVYWTWITLLQNTANYATTFVAQYVGAGRPHRVGPSIWQAFYFSVFAGIAFLGLIPLAGPIMALGGHSAAVQELEVVYFRCLCFAALPTLIVAAANSFFAGRGDSWTVMLVDVTGLCANSTCAYLWIFGQGGFPKLGIAGAGWAVVVGSSVSALLALALFFRLRYRKEYQTLAGWRFDPELFGRLMQFGFPNGLQWMLEALAFTVFLFLVGRLGNVELAATNIAFSINMIALVPMLGMGQAVLILVGLRLGQDRPELAERSTWTGFGLAAIYMFGIILLYVLAPGLFLYCFENTDDQWPLVSAWVPVLLRFVVVYSFFDSMNLIFAFALRGAGDTRFVTVAMLVLSWPLMVFPTAAVWHYGGSLYWAWTFASGYIIVMGFLFLWRFRQGKWKSMRVIEVAPVVTSRETVEV